MIDLNPHHLETVNAILAEHVPECEVRAFGSRATWTAKDYSDLDLAIVGKGPLDWKMLGHLKEAFEESNLPMRVDVLDWNSISENFRRAIKQDCVVIQKRGKQVKDGDWHNVASDNSVTFTTLGCVAEIVMGQSPPGHTVSQDGELPLLNGPTEFGAHHPIPVQYTVDPRRQAQEDDILFCVRGSTTGRMNWADQDYAIGRGIAAIRHKQDLTLQPFVRAVIESQLPELLAQATGSTFPNVSAKQLKDVPFPCLDIEQQHHIAHILGTLDDKIELNRRMNATLEGMARTLFKSWFVDFEPVRAKMEGRWRRGESLPGMPAELYDLFPQRLVPSELGEVPEGWDVKALGEVVELAYGKSLRADKRLGGHIPVYGSNGQIGWHNEKLVTGPGVIVGRKGNSGAVAWSHTDFYPIDTTFYVKPKTEEISLYFLLFALQGQNLPSVAADSAVPGLNRNLAYMNEQLVPSAEIVAAFDQQANALFAKIQCLEGDIRTLAGLRDALLPELVSGEVRCYGAGALGE